MKYKLLKAIGPLVLLIHYFFVHLQYLLNRNNFLKTRELKNEINHSVEKLLVYLAVSNRVLKQPNEAMLRIFRNNGYAVMVLLVGEIDEKVLLESYLGELSDAVIVKKNLGYDFGGYKSLLPYFEKLQPNEIILLNDSIYFPATNPDRFMSWLRGIQEFGAASINYGDEKPHYQSFFVVFRGFNALNILYKFLRCYIPLNSRVHAINSGEKVLSDLLNSSDVICQCYSDEIISELKTEASKVDFMSRYFNTNITHSIATTLIKMGYPFLKWDIFSKRIAPHEVYAYGIKIIPVAFEKDKFIKYCSYLLIRKPRGIYYMFLSFYGIK